MDRVPASEAGGSGSSPDGGTTPSPYGVAGTPVVALGLLRAELLRIVDRAAGQLHAALLPYVLLAGGAVGGHLASLTRAACLAVVAR